MHNKFFRKLLGRLELYQAGEKSHKSLHDPMLATLRGSMDSNPMAAYIILLVSSVGHDWEMFQKHGWPLLDLLLDCQMYEQILSACSYIFPGFLRMHSAGADATGDFLYQDKRTLQFWSKFFRTANLDRDFDSVFNRLAPVIYTNGQDYLLYTRFFLSVGLVKEWQTNSSCLRMIDMLCELAIAGFECYRLAGLFSQKSAWQLVEEYLLAEYMIAIPGETSSTPGILQKVMDYVDLGSTRPLLSLVHGSHYDFGLGVSGLIEKDSFWFVFAALRIEARKEKPVRQQLGNIFLQNPLIPVDQITDKPLSHFVVHRVSARE